MLEIIIPSCTAILITSLGGKYIYDRYLKNTLVTCIKHKNIIIGGKVDMELWDDDIDYHDAQLLEFDRTGMIIQK